MKHFKWILLLLAVFAFLFFGFRGPSDRELIVQAIDESSRAGREGRPGGVLEYLSKSLKVNEVQFSGGRDFSRFVRESRPDVKLLNPQFEIDEASGSATVTSPVVVTATIFGMGEIKRDLEKVVIRLEREGTRKWLLFPARIWRIVSVEAPDLDVSTFLSP